MYDTRLQLRRQDRALAGHKASTRLSTQMLQSGAWRQECAKSLKEAQRSALATMLWMGYIHTQDNSCPCHCNRCRMKGNHGVQG